MKNLLHVSCLILISTLCLSACTSSDDDDTATDIGATEAGATETGTTEAGATEAGATEAGVTEAGVTETGTTEAGATEAGATEAGGAEAGVIEAGGTEAGSTEAGGTEAGSTEAGGTEAGSTDDGSTNPMVMQSCEQVDFAVLQANGGVFSTVLPAELLTNGAQIEMSGSFSGQFTAFDASTGAVDYVPTDNRLSSTVDYEVKSIDGTVLSSHTHRWVFSPVRIMPLGDSITSGVEFFDGSNDLPPMAERVGYRKFLFDQLDTDGYTIDYLGQGGQAAGAAAGLADPENNGYPGVDIDFLNGKLVEQLTEDKVDVILLHIGTNNTPANAQGIEDWLDTLDAWEADNQPVLAMVASIVPKRDASLNVLVEQFNQDLTTRIAARTNDLVVLVDQNAAVEIADLSTEQIGLHPSAAGYEKMAAAWYDALTNVESDALYKCDSTE